MRIDFYWQFVFCYARHINAWSHGSTQKKILETGFGYGMKQGGLFLFIKTMYALYDALKATNDEHEFINLVYNIQYEFHRFKVLHFAYFTQTERKLELILLDSFAVKQLRKYCRTGSCPVWEWLSVWTIQINQFDEDNLFLIEEELLNTQFMSPVVTLTVNKIHSWLWNRCQSNDHIKSIDIRYFHFHRFITYEQAIYMSFYKTV